MSINIMTAPHLPRAQGAKQLPGAANRQQDVIFDKKLTGKNDVKRAASEPPQPPANPATVEHQSRLIRALEQLCAIPAYREALLLRTQGQAIGGALDSLS